MPFSYDRYGKYVRPYPPKTKPFPKPEKLVYKTLSYEEQKKADAFINTKPTPHLETKPIVIENDKPKEKLNLSLYRSAPLNNKS